MGDAAVLVRSNNLHTSIGFRILEAVTDFYILYYNMEESEERSGYND
jgi:hypothetical protein